MSISKADQKKIGTYGFHEPNPADCYDPDSFGVISVYKIEANVKGDGLRTRSSGIQLRFKRSTTDEAIKLAKRVVKDLNAGVDVLEGRRKRVICVPTGNPRGRRPST